MESSLSSRPGEAPLGLLTALLAVGLVLGCASRAPVGDAAAARFERAVRLAEAGQLADAEAVFRDLVAEGVYGEESRNNLGVVLAAGGRFEAALHTFRGTKFPPARRNLHAVFAYLDARHRGAAPGSTPLTLELVGSLGSAPVEPATTPPPAEPAETEGAAVAESVPARAPLAESEAPETAARAPATVPPPAAEPPPAMAAEAARRLEVEERVRAWATAWDDQEIEAYLAFYSQAFLPSDGDRGAWERQRRRILGDAKVIEVEVGEIDVRFQPGLAIASFPQAYSSDTFKDQVTKTLKLAREGEAWMIVEESGR